VQLFCGGADPQLLRSLQSFVKTLKCKRLVRGAVFGALAAARTGATTTLALFRVACLKACYACPDKYAMGMESRLLSPGEIATMGGRNKDLCLQGEQIMRDARTLLTQLPAGSLQDSEATHIVGQLEVRVVMHVFQKKDATRKSFKSLAEIGVTFWNELIEIVGTGLALVSPWPAAEGPSTAEAPKAKQAAKGLRELTAAGQLANPVALLSDAGIVVGAHVRNKEHGQELEVLAVTTATVSAKDRDCKKSAPIVFDHDEFMDKHTVIRHVLREDFCPTILDDSEM